MGKSGSDRSAVSLPSGTGSAAGLGEAFRVNLNTGQGTYSVPLGLPSGTAGHTPQLKLEYSSSREHGPFGLGWHLSLREISRRLDVAVPDEGGVERFLDGGTELLQLENGEFRARMESAFTRYLRVGDGWQVLERSGLLHEMGTSPAERISPPEAPTRPVRWLLSKSVDTSGNEIHYRWDISNGTAYLVEVSYSAFRFRLFYEERPDIRRNGRAGFLRTLDKRCARMELSFASDGGERLLRSWQLGYVASPHNGASMLSTIAQNGHGAAADGSLDASRPTLTFSYSSLSTAESVLTWVESPSGQPPPSMADADVALCTLDPLPLPGVLQTAGGEHVYWPNTGDGHFGPPRRLRDVPHVSSLRSDGALLADMEGNGTTDLVVLGGEAPLHGYYQNAGGANWSRFVAYPRARAAAPPFARGQTRPLELDGDGRVDALTSQGRAFAAFVNLGEQGWSSPRLVPKGDGDSGPDVDFADPLVRVADMTGDGLPDIVRIQSGLVEYWPNLGHGRFGPRVRMRNSPRLPDASREPEQIVLADFDGDGIADLARVTATGLQLWINQAGNSFSSVDIPALLPAPLPGTLRAADFYGRGRAGLLWNARRGGQTAYFFFQLGGAAPPHQLEQIIHGTGLVSHLSYRWSVEDAKADAARGEAWDTHLPFPLAVIAETLDEDAFSGVQVRTTYRYHRGHFEPSSRQFHGFARVEKQEFGDESRADVLSVHHFFLLEERKPGAARERAFVNGLEARIETYSLDGPLQHLPYRVEENEPDVRLLNQASDGRDRAFVFVAKARTRHLDRSADERVEEKSYTYDDFGNVLQERSRRFGQKAGAAVPEAIETTDVTYAVHPEGRIWDRPSRVVRRDGAGALLSEIRRYYDGPDHVGLPLGQLTRGLLCREEHLVLPEAAFLSHYAGLSASDLGYTSGTDADGGPAFFLQKERARYDLRGLKIEEMDSVGNVVSLAYDAAGLYLAERTDALGTSRMDYDPNAGRPTRIVDPDGTTIDMSYDGLGRLVRVVLPGDSAALPTREYRYDDGAAPEAVRAAYRIESGSPEQLQMAVYYDGFGKELQRRVGASAGRVVVSGRQLKNPWGQVRAEYEPQFESSLEYSPPPLEGRPSRRFFFDGMGRPLRVVNYSGGESTSEYLPFSTVIRDASDNDLSADNVARGIAQTPRREEYDVYHRRISVVEETATGPLTTRYGLDGAGRMASHSDDSGVVGQYTYDLLGNRLTVQHRDAGNRSLCYDAASRVVRSTDGRGIQLIASFDAVGRLSSLRAGSELLEQYTYDGPEAFSRLSEVSYPGGRQQFRYTPRGKLRQHTYHFDGHASPYVLSFEYNALGLEKRATYPNGATVQSEYFDNGWLRRIPGYLEEADYDARGFPTLLRFANGVTTRNEYTEGVGRISRQRVAGPTDATLADSRFSYDLLGNLTQEIADGEEARSYLYDPLQQLVSSQLGSQAPVEYRYSGRNLVYQGETELTLDYADAAHSGRLSSFRRGSQPAFAVPYDANGNILQLPQRQFQYDNKGQLSRVDRSDGTVARYEYDFRGRRVRKRVERPGQVTETAFLSDRVEIRDGQLIFFVGAGKSRIALVTPTHRRYIHCDAVGSARFFTDEAGQPLARIAYHPFGNVQSASPGSADIRLFALHPFDEESGLYYLGRRHYAPEIGRFIQPDPLFLYQPDKEGGEPRTLCLYTYVDNDPLNRVDPSGLSVESVLGAIVGAIVGIVVGILFIIALCVGVGWVILAIVGIIALVTAGYLGARYTTGGWQDFFRGFLIGLNAGLNFVFVTAICVAFLPFGVALAIGIVIGLIGFLSAFDTIAQSEVYQGILGWSQWLMPMSWLTTGLGLIFFVLNVLGAVFTGWQVRELAITEVAIDWKTGTIFMRGGWISNLNAWDTAFNMGNFAFVDVNSPQTTDFYMEHEAGHSLNLAAFGSAFHFVGFIDELISGGNAFAEQLAEGNDPAATGPTLPMWN
jgi:RHS repeat-associated protein